MQSLARNGYTSDQVKTALHSGVRSMYFRYDLLDLNNKFKRSLTNVTGGSVANNALANIKRTAKFTLLDDGGVNFLSDRIQPWCRLKMFDGGFAEFPLGVFLLTTPPKQSDASDTVTREIDAYDQLQVLNDDKVENRYTINSGTNYITAVGTLLTGAGITLQNLTPTTKTLPTDQDWDPGTTKLQIINDLLGAINYRSLWFDEMGYAIAQPYVTPDQRASEYTYSDDSQSVIFPEVQQTLDLFNIPNKWVLVVSEADRPSIMSVYTNSNPYSLTSTVSRGRTIVDYRTGEQAPDQASLDAKAQRYAFEASQVYETVDFMTAIMPMHSDLDVFTLNFSRLGISSRYSESSWSFDLKAGAQMKHSIRRVVSI